MVRILNKIKLNPLIFSVVCVAIAFFTLALASAWVDYLRFNYTSDGFYYFSAIKNTAYRGDFFYQGPMFQHLFGEHAYLILIFLVPLIAVLPFPIVLLVLQIINHAIGLIIFLLIVNRAMNKFRIQGTLNKVTLFALSMLYLLLDPVTHVLTSQTFLFQPDSFIEPLFMASIYFALTDRSIAFVAALIGIGLVKEEYIVQPVVVLSLLWIFSWPYYPELRAFLRRVILPSCVAILCTGILSVVTLIYCKALNSFPYGSVSFDASAFLRSLGQTFLLHPPREVANFIGYMAAPVAPLVALMLPAYYFCSGRLKPWLGLVPAMLIITALVIKGAMSYGIETAVPLANWKYIMLTPIMMTIIAFYLLPLIAELPQRRWTQSLFLMALCAALSIQVFMLKDCYLRQQIIALIWYQESEAEKVHREEVVQIRQAIPTNYFTDEYFISPEYIIYPFMDRAHVSLPRMLEYATYLATPARNREIMREIAKHAAYVILPKLNATPQAVAGIWINKDNPDFSQKVLRAAYEFLPLDAFRVLKETQNYYVLQNTNSMAKR